MRLTNPRHLGLYVRDRRRDLGMTQATLCTAAQVSRRWLSDLERGKSTAEIGLVFRVLAALRLAIDVRPEMAVPGGIDLDEVIHRHTRPVTGEDDHD